MISKFDRFSAFAQIKVRDPPRTFSWCTWQGAQLEMNLLCTRRARGSTCGTAWGIHSAEGETQETLPEKQICRQK